MIFEAIFPHMYMYILLTLHIAIATSTQVIINEGELAAFVFQFPDQDNFAFTVQIGKRYPFYNSQVGKVDSVGLTTDQIGRFSVSTKQGGDETIQIHIQIVNTSREDAGFFICIGSNADQPESYTLRKIELNIDYSPGKASCTFETVMEPVEGWALLTCTALLGSNPGMFECYQDCEKIPPKNDISQNITSFWQAFWVRKSLSGVCCSSLYTKKKDFLQCNDFEWNYLEKTNTYSSFCSFNGEGTGTTTTSDLPNSRPLSFTSDISYDIISTDMGDKVQCTNVDSHWMVIAEILISIFFGLGIVLISIIIYLKIQCKKGHIQNNCTNESHKLNTRNYRKEHNGQEIEINLLLSDENDQTNEEYETQNYDLRIRKFHENSSLSLFQDTSDHTNYVTHLS